MGSHAPPKGGDSIPRSPKGDILIDKIFILIALLMLFRVLAL